jgi:hypothetical protein
VRADRGNGLAGSPLPVLQDAEKVLRIKTIGMP